MRFFWERMSLHLFWTYKSFMSESLLSTIKQKSIQKQKSQASPQVAPTEIPPKKAQHSPLPFGKLRIQDSEGLYEENRKLRRKLKELSSRLDEELEKAAEFKLKMMSQRVGHPVTAQSQSLELQNAYKMIERLQKTVKDYESKESYQVTLKRVMDLEGIIKKKEEENEQLRTEIKTQKKIVKEREKYIEELIENAKKLGNPTEDLETINKLKLKMKKVAEEGESLRRKEMEKHEKLVKAERRIMELENGDRQMPQQISNLQKQLEESRAKYKEVVQRLERQNIYIAKLNEKLTKQQEKEKTNKKKKETEKTDRKHYSVSLDELPKIKPNIHRNQLVADLQASPRVKRY